MRDRTVEKKQVASQKYKKRSTFASMWRQLRKNKGALIGLFMLVLIVGIAIASPYVFDYETQVIANNVKNRLQAPSAEHWFGTDDMGRDIFARVCYGARYSLAVGVVAVLFALVFGVTWGAAAGYIGGPFEDISMRICDIFSSIPSVLMAIAVVSALGKSTFNLMLAVGITSTAPFVRVALHDAVSGPCHHGNGAIAEPYWRRPARCPGSQAETITTGEGACNERTKRKLDPKYQKPCGAL